MTSSVRSFFAAALRGLVVGCAALVTLELMPRLPWVRLPTDLGNRLFQCYEPEFSEESIFFTRPELGLHLLRPNFQASCYLNGRRWHHRTDAYGQRNPETWEDVEIALVGDAPIYGEGTEEDETAAHLLRELLGQRVANLGQPVASPAEYLAILRNFALPLHPKIVVVAVSANDLRELMGFDGDRLRQFIASGEGPEMSLSPREMLLLPEDGPPHRSVGAWMLHHCLTCRTLRHYGAAARQSLVDFGVMDGLQRGANLIERSAMGDSPPPVSPTPQPESASDTQGAEDRQALARAYLDASIRAMTIAAKAANVRLVLAYLPAQPDATRRAEEPIPRQLNRVASELNIDFFDPSSDLLTTDRYGRPVYDRDGEGLFGRGGQKKLAEMLALFLRDPGAYLRSR